MTAFAVFMVTLVVYLCTVSPTISFWDNPEFVTCASIMGIPHPPGSPLLSLTTRCIMLVPFNIIKGRAGAAWRANLLAVLSGALTALITYLVMGKLLTRMTQSGRMPYHQKLILFCSALASFLVGFSNQFWENSIENETYLPSFLVSLIALWLVMAWEERKENPASLLYLLCASYCVGLGIGIHLYALLVAPALFLVVLLAKPEWFAHVKLWLSIVIAAAVLFVTGHAGG